MRYHFQVASSDSNRVHPSADTIVWWSPRSLLHKSCWLYIQLKFFKQKYFSEPSDELSLYLLFQKLATRRESLKISLLFDRCGLGRKHEPTGGWTNVPAATATTAIYATGPASADFSLHFSTCIPTNSSARLLANYCFANWSCSQNRTNGYKHDASEPY